MSKFNPKDQRSMSHSTIRRLLGALPDAMRFQSHVLPMRQKYRYTEIQIEKYRARKQGYKVTATMCLPGHVQPLQPLIELEVGLLLTSIKIFSFQD